VGGECGEYGDYWGEYGDSAEVVVPMREMHIAPGFSLYGADMSGALGRLCKLDNAERK
jgi:hypothetical protein